MNAPLTQSALFFQHPSRLVRRTGLRTFWVDLVGQIAPRRSASCLITTDADLRRMNREFLRKDYATDVLSFPARDSQDPLPEASEMLGEIAISLDRAAEQASQLGHGLEEELRILMLHGVLHLTGLDHETDSGVMARAEARWRKKLGLPLGLIERATSALQPKQDRHATRKKVLGR